MSLEENSYRNEEDLNEKENTFEKKSLKCFFWSDDEFEFYVSAMKQVYYVCTQLTGLRVWHNP